MLYIPAGLFYKPGLFKLGSRDPQRDRKGVTHKCLHKNLENNCYKIKRKHALINKAKINKQLKFFI